MLNQKVSKLIKTGFFHIFGSSVINKIISFLSSVILVRVLTKSEYGYFTYSWNIYCILILLNGMSLDSGVLQLCSERSEDKAYCSAIANYGAKKGIIVNILLCLLILLIALFSPLKFENSKNLLILLCLLPLIQFLFNMISAYLRANKRNQDFAKITTLNTVILFLCSVLLSFLFREKGLVLSYYIAYGFTVFFAYKFLSIHLFQVEKDSNKFDRDPIILTKKEKKNLFSISFVTMCNNGLSQLMYLIDVFVLGIVASNELTLASYKVATTIPSALTFIPLSLITYLYPYFAEKRNDGRWCIEKYKKILLGFGGFNLLLSSLLLIFAPTIISVFFGSQYADSVLIFRILSINYFISGTFRILSGNLLVTQRKIKFNFFVALVSGVVNVLADFFFIQWWGSVGAAIATVLVVLVSSIMSTGYLIHTFKKSIKEEKI